MRERARGLWQDDSDVHWLLERKAERNEVATALFLSNELMTEEQASL